MVTKQHSCSSILACLFLLSSLTPPIHCSRQSQALSRLFRAKLHTGSYVDTSHFEAGAQRVEPSRFTVGWNQRELKERDRIGRLPGQPKVDFAQYGGYVTVDESSGRAFYYYFAESTNSTGSNMPLLLWLNGGPGCSSLAYGAMQELGPFRVHSDGKTLYRNRYSWNTAANVLFVESPAGVGFSYTNTTSDLENLGDRNTAADNHVFLVNWLERFPEYKDRDFYIAGESYAGHYVPQLAHTILLYNKMGGNRTIINLKGIMIGNAVINDETDLIGMYDYFETHSLISEETLTGLKKNCDLSASTMSKQSDECTAASDRVDADTYYLDIYNIYAPLCVNSTLTSRPKKAALRMMEFDPCSDYYVHAYLNRPEVQAALHANVTKLPYDWEPCSDIIQKWNDSPSSVIPLLRHFIASGLRVWVFSGDIDGRVPVTSTKYSLKRMNLTTATPWHPWYLGGEVGGYTEEYEGGKMTFATVRGAGHQVPSYQPKRALSLVSHFLHATPLPDTTRYQLSF